jgi:NADH:ubiquinone reductase (H+-translocating)
LKRRSQNMTVTQEQHVVVVGGGYAGQMAAARLAKKGLSARITLVDPNPDFVERIRLHQLAAGQQARPRPMREMLGSIGVGFVQAKATAIDVDARILELALPGEMAGPEKIHYDWLIYALGSRTRTKTVPGVAEYALTLDSPAHAARLFEAAAALSSRQGRLLVVGGGLTGIETVAELAERFPGLQVNLLTGGRLGDGFAPAGAKHLRGALARLRVTVHEEERVAALQEGMAISMTGARRPFDLCLWAGGFEAAPLAREAGLPVNVLGQIITEPSLQVPGHPEILAVGDAARVLGSGRAPLRMACATAIPMGAHAADVLAQLWQGRTPSSFRFAFLARNVSLGRGNGLIQLLTADDKPLPWLVTGRAAAWIKEMVCRFAVDALAAERRLPGRVYRWPQPQREVAASLVRV